MHVAKITGVLTSVAAVVPSFLHPGARSYIDATFYVIAAIDSFKMIAILMFLTWVITSMLNHFLTR